MRPPAERFWPKVVAAENGCMAWIGARDSSGYGTFVFDRPVSAQRWRTVSAHRWVYEQIRGEIPEGLELDHLCSNPRCVNPWHLEPVTHTVNIRRGRAPAVTAARYANWTTCKAGHRVEGDNAYLYTTSNGFAGKQCRACKAANQRRYLQKKRAT